MGVPYSPVPLLFFPFDFCEIASTFVWEWETSTLQRLGKAQALRVYIICIYICMYVCAYVRMYIIVPFYLNLFQDDLKVLETHIYSGQLAFNFSA